MKDPDCWLEHADCVNRDGEPIRAGQACWTVARIETIGAELGRAAARRQGLPEKLEDPAVAAQVAAILFAGTEAVS